MKKAFALLICALFVSAFARAQDAAAPEAAPVPAAGTETPAAAPDASKLKIPTMLPLEVRKTGTVSVMKDADGKVSAIKLIVTSYDIQLDDEGKKLEALDGQKVRVSCTLNHEDGKKILIVKSVEPVTTGGAAAIPAPAAAPAVPAAPAEKPAEAAPAAE